MATPIGHIGDLPPRACAVLANACMVLAEDTRRAGKMLAEAGVEHGPLLSFYDHNEQERMPEVLALLTEGRELALVSDAGTPLLSDPGYRLVRACRQQGIPVSAVPGPCAPVVALSAAGIAPLPFTFLGFLPRGKGDIRRLLRLYGATPATLVFFERKDRLQESLALAHAVLGDREVAICRELTKPWEEFIIGRLAAAQELAQDLRGELTIVVGPPQALPRMPEAEALALLQQQLATGQKPKSAARAVAAQAPGWKPGELYQLLFQGSGGGEDGDH